MSKPSLAIVITADHLNDSSAPITAIENFIDIYEDESEKIWIIGPTSTSISRNSVELISVTRGNYSNIISRIIDYNLFQAKLAYEIFHLRDRIDLIFFHIGGGLALLPVLAAKAGDITTANILTGSPSQSYVAQTSDSVFNSIVGKSMATLETITYSMSDGIVLLAENLQKDVNINWSSTERYVANLNYINTYNHYGMKDIRNRDSHIIFVGRFTAEKGIQRLIHSLPNLIKSHPSIQVELVGDGPLRDELEQFVENEGLDRNVKFTGWLERDDVITHLSNAQFIVIPSCSEGLPKVLLEGMACGTIPVATRVGGIPDVINDCENGFFLPNNNPETIEKTLSSLLGRNDLESISEKARAFIQNNYSFDETKQNYVEILNKMLS